MDQVGQVREKIDLVALISEFIALKKAGQNFKGLCPFHGEKTPSFVVSSERQIWHCFGCFPPGEKIKTPFGYHNIEEIDTDHWVVSGNGNIRKVTDVMVHNYDGSLISVGLRKLKGIVRLTADHNVFVVRGAPYMHKQYKNFSRRYKKYLKIRKSDEYSYQRLLSKYLPIKKIPAGKLQKGDLLLYPINRRVADIETIDLSGYRNKFTNYGPVPKKIPLKVSVDEGFLKLLGYYIAEGSSHRAYIRFSLGNHEEDFAREIVDLIKKIFSLEAKIHRRPHLTKTGIEITACHAHLANIFDNLCGKGAANKHIPFTLQELPAEKQKVLLNSIFKGDGTSFKPNRSQKLHKGITTVSKVLAEQLVDILLRMNIFPAKHVEKKHVDKQLVNHKESYSVFWSEEARQKYNAIYYSQDGFEYWLLPITTLGKEYYQGPVHNFTVDQDNSYIATNFAVANCQKGGDAFTFLMEYEHIDFPESLRILAKKTGVELAKTQFEKGVSSKRERLYEINHLAREYYHYVLTKHRAGEKAKKYLLEKRKIKPPVLETFQLGFAPSTGTSLCDYLILKKGYKREDILEVGLGVLRNSQIYDFFSGRIIFPLIDHRDNVVGFSARALNDTQLPKYVNTKETFIYHKGSHLFAINIAKGEIRKENKVLVMEGEFDVISAFEEGFGFSVAIKGTALTENQAKILSRFTNQVALCFDKDSAGEEALLRSIPVLEKEGCTITVVEYENGKDPNESIQNNVGEFKKAVKQNVSVYDYILQKALREQNPQTSEGKRIIASKTIPFFVGIQNEIIKEHFLKKLSEELDTSYESIVREAEKKSLSVVVPKVAKVIVEKREREEVLEEYLLSLILQSEKPKENLEKVIGLLSDFMPKERAYQKMMHYLLDYCIKVAQFDHGSFSRSLPTELLSVYDKSVLLPIPQFEEEKIFLKEIEKTSRELKRLYLRSNVKQLTKIIEEKEEKGENVEKEEKRLSFLIESLKD